MAEDTNEHSPSCPHKKGSWEQLECLRLRAEHGEELFRPDDNPDCETGIEAKNKVNDRIRKARKNGESGKHWTGDDE